MSHFGIFVEDKKKLTFGRHCFWKRKKNHCVQKRIGVPVCHLILCPIWFKYLIALVLLFCCMTNDCGLSYVWIKRNKELKPCLLQIRNFFWLTRSGSMKIANSSQVFSKLPSKSRSVPPFLRHAMLWKMHPHHGGKKGMYSHPGSANPEPQ